MIRHRDLAMTNPSAFFAKRFQPVQMPSFPLIGHVLLVRYDIVASLHKADIFHHDSFPHYQYQHRTLKLRRKVRNCYFLAYNFVLRLHLTPLRLALHVQPWQVKTNIFHMHSHQERNGWIYPYSYPNSYSN